MRYSGPVAFLCTTPEMSQNLLYKKGVERVTLIGRKREKNTDMAFSGAVALAPLAEPTQICIGWGSKPWFESRTNVTCICNLCLRVVFFLFASPPELPAEAAGSAWNFQSKGKSREVWIKYQHPSLFIYTHEPSPACCEFHFYIRSARQFPEREHECVRFSERGTKSEVSFAIESSRNQVNYTLQFSFK